MGCSEHGAWARGNEKKRDSIIAYLLNGGLGQLSFKNEKEKIEFTAMCMEYKRGFRAPLENFLKAAQEKAAQKAAEEARISQQKEQIKNLIAGFTFAPL